MVPSLPPNEMPTGDDLILAANLLQQAAVNTAESAPDESAALSRVVGALQGLAAVYPTLGPILRSMGSS